MIWLRWDSPSARGYCGVAGHALHVHCAVMDRALRRKLPRRYFDTVWAAVARCNIMERLSQLIRRDKVAIQLGK
jgi:hypothetical protein